MKSTYTVLGIIIGAIIVAGVHYISNLFVLPLVLISLGFLLMGIVAPELFEKVSKYSRTIWLPLLVLFAGFFGILLSLFMFTGHFLPAIFISTTWCTQPPCYPFGMLLLSFVVGNIMNWIMYYIEHKEINLLGL
ncbi:MAG: hypothetical protein J7K68_03130 [Candidatus Diapherotrites archaeon]|nr:hypothetical protein [Candidatus Diapherotrites archaeon]